MKHFMKKIMFCAVGLTAVGPAYSMKKEKSEANGSRKVYAYLNDINDFIGNKDIEDVQRWLVSIKDKIDKQTAYQILLHGCQRGDSQILKVIYKHLQGRLKECNAWFAILRCSSFQCAAYIMSVFKLQPSLVTYDVQASLTISEKECFIRSLHKVLSKNKGLDKGFCYRVFSEDHGEKISLLIKYVKPWITKKDATKVLVWAAEYACAQAIVLVCNAFKSKISKEGADKALDKCNSRCGGAYIVNVFKLPPLYT